MSEQLLLALFNLIVKFGIDKAIDIFTGVTKAATVDEAIAALQATQKKTWEDYKKEA